MILLLLSEITLKSGDAIENPDISSPPGGRHKGGGGRRGVKSGDFALNPEI